MKNLKFRIPTFLLLIFMCYLIAAFINTTFDFTKWSEFTRYVVGLFGTIVSLGITYMLED